MGSELLVFYFILLLLILCPILLQAQEYSTDHDEQPCGSEVCGDVEIRSPFGIRSRCYDDTWFKVTCHGKKPFLNMNGYDVEALYLGSDGIIINNPVSYVNYDDHKSKGSTVVVSAVNLTGTPFYFSSQHNYFGSVGCGSLATVSYNEADDPVGACAQPTCGGGGGGDDDFGIGCFTQMSAGNLTWYAVNMTAMDPGDSSNKRALAFMFFGDNIPSMDSSLPHGINAQTTHVPALLSIDSTYCGAAGCNRPGSMKIITEKSCGNLTFQYPFGVNHQDHSNDWFGLICDETDNTNPLPYLNINDIHLQILDFSFIDASFTVNHPITYTDCRENKSNGMSLNLTGTRYYYSRLHNVFWSSGCGNLVTVFDNKAGNVIGGCLQPRCSTSNSNEISSADGCQITIPRNLSSFYANMSGYRRKTSCGSAFIMTSQSYYNLQETPGDFDPSSRTQYVPTQLQWGVPLFGLCNLNEGVDTSCNSDRTQCWSRLSPTHLCYCSKDKYSDVLTHCEGENCGGYKWCHILCLNTPDSYCSSKSCPPNYEYKHNSTGFTCQPKISPPTQKNWRLTIIIIGCSTSLGSIFLLLVTWQMYKLLKRRKNKMLKQKYFKRNGGLLLQQHLSGNNVEKIKLFTSREMGKATDYYNENRILGRGGQGTVYKGMLTDGSIVAIKKYTMVETGKKFDERKVEQFINEVIILSQINHRNVVQLLGCCLEAQVPLLVYEFIPNGTLYDLIHCPPDQEFKLTWEMRIRIAIEIANALFYLHSAASVPIYHRDIKSSNILLDDKYRAKVSDFGTSRSVALEQTHLTTHVKGTFGYMDPEYFRSSQFTEKSDVYSFGVVLVELLTGQKPVSSKETEEARSLVSYFLLSMRENSLVDILDSVVIKDGIENEITAVAKLARRCLNLNGKKRPSMKQVVLELESIKASKEEGYAIEEEEEEESGDEESEFEDPIESWDIMIPSCATTRSIGTDSVSLPLNASF